MTKGHCQICGKPITYRENRIEWDCFEEMIDPSVGKIQVKTVLEMHVDCVKGKSYQ